MLLSCLLGVAMILGRHGMSHCLCLQMAFSVCVSVQIAPILKTPVNGLGCILIPCGLILVCFHL